MGLNLRSMDDDPNNAWSRWRAAAAAPASASNGGINVNVSVGSLGGGGGGHGGFSWEEAAFAEDSGSTWPPRSYSCNFCRKEFRSAQALGGHMNNHRRDRARLRQGISLGSAGTVPPQQQHQQRNSDEFSGGGGGAPAPQPPDLRAVVPGLISWPHLGADQGFNIKQQQQQQNQVFWQSKAANFYRGSSSNLPAACSSSASCVSPPSTVLSMSLFSNSKNPTTTSSVYQYHHHHQYPNNWQQQQQCLHPIIQSEILVSSDSSDSSELLEPSKYRQSMDFHVGYAGSRNTEHSNLRDMAAPEDDDAEGGEEEEEEEEELDLELRLGDSRRPPLNKIPSSNGGF